MHPKTHPILPSQIGIRPKPALFYTQILGEGHLGGVCFCALHGYTQNLPGFRRKFLSQDISGRMQYAPTRIHEKTGGFHISPSGYTKNLPDFRRKPLSQDISERMLLRPTRIHEKFGRFYTQTFGEDRLGAYAIRPYTGT